MVGERKTEPGWIGIPSVPPERAVPALIAFYLAIAVTVAVDILLITHNHQPKTWQLTAEMVFDDGGQIVAWALAATWPTMEAMRMVLASIWENRIRRRAIQQGLEQGLEQGIAQGIQQGKDDANRLWREWLERREQAAAQGELFDEPMPDEKGNIARSDNPNGRQS